MKRNEEMVKLLDACQMKESSFFFARRDDKSGNYCLEQVDNCISNPAIMAIISRAFYLLTVDNVRCISIFKFKRVVHFDKNTETVAIVDVVV